MQQLIVTYCRSSRNAQTGAAEHERYYMHPTRRKTLRMRLADSFPKVTRYRQSKKASCETAVLETAGPKLKKLKNKRQFKKDVQNEKQTTDWN